MGGWALVYLGTWLLVGGTIATIVLHAIALFETKPRILYPVIVLFGGPTHRYISKAGKAIMCQAIAAFGYVLLGAVMIFFGQAP